MENELKFKGIMENEDIIACLENLLSALKEGSITVRHGEEQIILTPLSLAKMEIKAGSKKNKEKLEIEISWKEGLEAGTESESLIISSTSHATKHEPGKASEPAENEGYEQKSLASSGPAITAGEEKPEETADEAAEKEPFRETPRKD